VTLHDLINTSDSNIHFPFSITSSTSMPILSFAFLRCMVHCSQSLVNPSSTTIMIHTSLCVFDKLTFVTLPFVDLDEYVYDLKYVLQLQLSCVIDDQFFVLIFLLMAFFLSYGIHKYVIIIVITYVLNNE
jgi:hypothetical protein